MIARGGMSFVLTPALLIIALMAAAILLSSYLAMILTIPVGIMFAVFVVFFRDPPRRIGRGIVSPADGRVLSANGDNRRVVVYMGILDVHVNRAPWSGVVEEQRRRRGGHSPAKSPASTGNSALEWRFGTATGTIVLTQVAGLFARRIVPYVRLGARVKKGQRIGLIRFGSRVELALPPRTRVVVRAGERVRAGETTIAEVTHEGGRQDTVR